jgi:hypothetical protein
MDSTQLKALAKNLKELANSLHKVADGLESQPKSSAKAKTKKAATPKAKKPAAAKAKQAAKSTTKKDNILKMIRRARKDLNIAALKKKTGYDTRTINNAVYRLKKENLIISPSKGVYRKA